MRKVLKKVYQPDQGVKLFWADIPASEARECYAKGENFELVYNGKTTILTPDDLKNKIIGKQDSGRGYELFAYKWDPINEEDDEQ